MEHIINDVGSMNFIYPNKDNISINDTILFNSSAPEGSNNGKYHCWDVPFNCKVKIDAIGGRGGNGHLGIGGFSDSRRGGYGARVAGTFNLTKGDKLLILIGGAASHASTGSVWWANGVSGAGGGATFVTKKIEDASSPYLFTGNDDPNTDIYKGWHLEPLVVAAGGNGGNDHSTFGGGRDGQYNGQGVTAEGEKLPTTGVDQQIGGGFSVSTRSSGTDSSNSDGYSFLCGGRGSSEVTDRHGSSRPGFGGGAANAETDGGGAGGWIPGWRDAAAYSFCNAIATDIEENANWNDNHGRLIITILDIIFNVDNISVYDNNKFNPANITNGKIFVNQTPKNITSAFVKTPTGLWKPLK